MKQELRDRHNRSFDGIRPFKKMVLKQEVR
jgi:hypothetical protein